MPQEQLPGLELDKEWQADGIGTVEIHGKCEYRFMLL